MSVTTMFGKALLKDGSFPPYSRFLVSVAGIVTVAAAAGLAALITPMPFGTWSRMALLFWFNLLLFPVLLGLYAILTHFFEHRALGSVGFAFHPRWKNELAIGLVAGAAMMLTVAGVEVLLGVARFSLAPAPPGKTILAGIFFFVLLMLAAANEELVFRGYPFQRLVDAGGPVFGVAVLSVLFGAAHLGNPFHTWISILNTTAVGVLLAICYLRTRALWLPLGIHFAWNFVQGYILGFPVSGLAFPGSVLQAKISGPLWLNGGAYGLEGSILSLGVIAAGTVYFFVSTRIFTTNEMQGLALGPGNKKASVNPLFSADSVPTGKR